MFENVDLMTAIITPFNENDEIDYVALKKINQSLIRNG